MFTGIVDAIGTIEHVSLATGGLELKVRARYRDLAPGESIAVNGVCLTVQAREDDVFTVVAMHSTLGRSTIGAWRAGTQVNLERAMRLGDLVGGHLVQGHVDGVGEVVRVERVDDSMLVDIAVPGDVAELVVPHGSITVDGVSLTVNALPAATTIQVSLVDYTQSHTTLGAVTGGTRVHLEADVIGRYVARLLGNARPGLRRE